MAEIKKDSPAADFALVYPVSGYALEAPRTADITLPYYADTAAEDAGLEREKFAALIECESRWDAAARGDKGTSLGILQFKRATFDLFSKKYGFEAAEIENSYHQITLASFMIRDGYINHWKNCAAKIGWL